MNENIKKRNNNSSNDLTVINSSLINKTFKESKKQIKKVMTAYKKDKAIGDFKINELLNDNTNKKKIKIKLKRIWSSQNVFINNKPKTTQFNKNIYNNKINFYCCSSIYSAPSVKQSKIKIKKLIKENKNKTLNYLNNIHNSIMIRESKLYREKINFFSKDNSYNNTIRNNLKKKYNMNDMNDINNINNVRNILKYNLKGYLINKRNKRCFSTYDLKRYRTLKRDILTNNENNIINVNDSTNKTNYRTRSNYFSVKNKTRNISQRNNKKYDMNNCLTNRTKILSAEIENINNQKTLLSNKSNIILYEYKRKNDYNKLDNSRDKSFLKYKDIEVSRMTFELNDILLNNNKKRKIKKINEIEKKIIKFKSLNNFQGDRLELMSKQDINSLEKRIELLQFNIKKYNKMSVQYFLKINNYLQFLKIKKSNLTNFFEEENNKKYSFFFDIEKLVTDNILKQKELEHLTEIKRFLIQVKNTLIKQPNYFNNILKEVSRKYELGKLILGLKIFSQDQTIIKFLESIPEIKDGEIQTPIISQKSAINKNSLKKNIINKKNTQLNIRKKLSDKTMINYLNNNEIVIFDTPEELITIFENLKLNNVKLMEEYDSIKRNIYLLKEEYKNIIHNSIIFDKYNDIQKKEEKIKQLKEENISLKVKVNYLKKNKNIEEEKDLTKNNNKEIKRNFFMDINIFRNIAYNKSLKNYKYKSLILLERLIDIVNNFFSLDYYNYGMNKAYKMVEKNLLNKLLKINKKNINNINKEYINDYILCLLKLYENICEYIKYRDKQYNLNEENKYIIQKKQEEIQLQRKINNAKNVRQLAEEKRVNGIEKIIKKNNKINILFKGNVDENIVIKNKIKRNKKLEEIGKYKNNILEKEFNFFVNYNDDN